MQAYSMDLRMRVLADSDAGLPTKQVLVPTLRAGDLGVMDNLSNHKGQRTPGLIRTLSPHGG